MVYKQTVIDGHETDDKTTEHSTAPVKKQLKTESKQGKSYLSTPSLETYELRTERLGNEFVNWAKSVRKSFMNNRSKLFRGIEDFQIEHDITDDVFFKLTRKESFKRDVENGKKWLGLHTFAGIVEGGFKDGYAHAALKDYSSHYYKLIREQNAYEDERKKALAAEEAKHKGPDVIYLERFPDSQLVPVKKEKPEEL